jgi:HEAT repeat protein
VDSLQSTNALLRATAAISLIWFEEKAEIALPALTNALNDPDPLVWEYAGDSIFQINASINRVKTN